jgi:hypothetical protein
MKPSPIFVYPHGAITLSSVTDWHAHTGTNPKVTVGFLAGEPLTFDGKTAVEFIHAYMTYHGQDIVQVQPIIDCFVEWGLE